MKKNALWFFAPAVGLGIAFAVESPYMAFALYAFLLLLLLSHFSSTAWLAGLDCERTVSATTLQQGEEATVEVKVTNQRGWPIPWIFFEDLYPKDFPKAGENTRLAILMPGRSVALKYTLHCPRRGYHRIGPLLMESGDLFGLQKRFRTGKHQDYVSVLPTVAYLETFTISARRPQGPVRITNRIYEDPTRIVGPREYVPGDPLNRIHWKASARTGALFTKTTEPSQVLGATLLLDLLESRYEEEKRESRMELAITTTASIAYLLQASGEQVGLLTNGRDAAEEAQYEVESRQALSREEAHTSVVGECISDLLSPLQVPTVRSPVQAQQIIENLARVLPGDSFTIEQVMMSEGETLPRDATLIPVVPEITEGLALTLATMKLLGFTVTVFLIDNQANYRAGAGLLAAHNIHVFHIEHERNLHDIALDRIGQ